MVEGDKVLYERLSDLQREVFFLAQVHDQDVDRIRNQVLVVIHEDGFVEQAEASISRMIEDIN